MWRWRRCRARRYRRVFVQYHVDLHDRRHGHGDRGQLTVTDNNGNNVGSASITIVGQTLRTTGLPATSANLAPLAALTFNIGGDYGGSDATLSGGAGTITCNADSLRSAVTNEPGYTDFDDGTAENANITFGPLENTASQQVSQSFAVVTRGSVPAIRRRPVGSRLLPAPDKHSIRRH